MIDPFGAFEAMQHGWRMFIHAKRQTGRTTAMVNTLREGDLVLVTSRAHGNRLEQECKRAGFEIQSYVAPTNHRIHELFDHLKGMRNKRVMFDHVWIECFIADRLAGMQQEFDHVCELLEKRHMEMIDIAPHGMHAKVMRDRRDQY